MIDAIGGRKVLVTILAFLTGIGCVALKGDIPTNFLALILGLVGFYITGNIFETRANALAVVAPDLTDIHTKLDKQSDAIATTQQGVGALVNYVNGAAQK